MAIEIRPATPGELPDFIDAMSTGFLDRPDIDKVAAEVAPLWDLSRAWVALDQGHVVGTFRSWATELTVPGGAQLTAAAVTNVTVLPTHRRRGILRAMVAADHANSRGLGEAASLLYAAEYPIYGRFGYGPGCRIATWTLDTHLASFLRPQSGRVELVRPGPDAREALRNIYDTWRLGHAGEIKRRDYRWDVDLGMRESAWGSKWKGYVALHRDAAGTVDGYARYRAEEKWEQGLPHGTVTIDELHALTDDAYADVWQFLASIDLVVKAKAELRRRSERLPWLLVNGRAASVSDDVDGMWVRLLDVARALGGRRYEREGSVILEVVDAEAPDGRIRIALETGPDGATAAATTRSADLTLPVAALGAAYLGGTRLRDAVAATGVDEHRTGALATADALFRTADEPWSSTFF